MCSSDLLGLFINWQLAVAMFGTRWLVMAVIMYPAAKRLGESDLVLLFPAFDLMMFLYYPLFLPALISKNRPDWK